MKTLELNQMEIINGSQDSRDCFFRGAFTLLGALACVGGFAPGCGVAIGITATSSHCF